MKSRILVRAATLLVLIACVGQVSARNVTDPDNPRQLEGDNAVSVSWEDPAGFSELRGSGNRWEAEQGDWVKDLAEHMQKRVGEVLPAGQTMDIHLTDIDLAGDYEPGRGMNSDRIRLMRDIYPPRISFDYTRTGADGQVIDEGQAKLSDMAYLSRSNLRYQSRSLAYEKRMVDDWIGKEVRMAGQ